MNQSWPTEVVESVAGFLDKVSQFAQRDGLAYRGQGNVDWNLEPSIDRDMRERGVTKYPERLQYEKDLMQRFEEGASAFLPPYERAHLEAGRVEWMAVMRHYGAPTRLLDWTESFPVAAYFASTDVGEKPNDGAILWIDLNKLKQYDWKSFGFSKSTDIDLAERIFADDCKSFVTLATPPVPFARIAAQRGLFTIGGRLGEVHDNELVRELPEDSYGRVVISARVKDEVCRCLWRLGIDAVSLQDVSADRCGLSLLWKRQNAATRSNAEGRTKP